MWNLNLTQIILPLQRRKRKREERTAIIPTMVRMPELISRGRQPGDTNDGIHADVTTPSKFHFSAM